MRCDICGKTGARHERVNRVYGKGNNLLVIENVPIISCPHCGESYLTSDTLDQLERIKRRRKRFLVGRTARVASFAR